MSITHYLVGKKEEKQEWSPYKRGLYFTLVALSCLQMILIYIKTNSNSNFVINLFRTHLNTTRAIGQIKINTTLPEERLDLTQKKPNCIPTGTHPSTRSVSVWKLAARRDLLPSTSRLLLCIPWSLMDITAPPHWVVPLGRHLLARKPRYRQTATRKDSMQADVMVMVAL